MAKRPRKNKIYSYAEDMKMPGTNKPARGWYNAIGSEQNADGEYLKHVVIAEINKEVKKGIPWSKCPNCGDPFRVTAETSTLCSDVCEREFADSLADG